MDVPGFNRLLTSEIDAVCWSWGEFIGGLRTAYLLAAWEAARSIGNPSDANPQL